MDEFVDDVVRIEREIVESLIKAGARYIHIDAPGFTAYVDGPSMDQMRSRGEDPARILHARSGRNRWWCRASATLRQPFILPRQPAQSGIARHRRHRRAAVQRAAA